MSSLLEREQELIELFEWIEDDTDRYVQIMDFGKNMPALDDRYKTEANEVKGCQSKVWLISRLEDGRVYFQADSNTSITKGIVAMLVFLWSDLSVDDFRKSNLEVLEKIQLRQHLSSQRSNGLTAMIHKMKAVVS